MSFLSSLPPKASITTKQELKLLLESYLASGLNPDLFDLACCLSMESFGRLRGHLLHLWSDWVTEGGEDDSGQSERGLAHSLIRDLIKAC